VEQMNGKLYKHGFGIIWKYFYLLPVHNDVCLLTNNTSILSSNALHSDMLLMPFIEMVIVFFGDKTCDVTSFKNVVVCFRKVHKSFKDLTVIFFLSSLAILLNTN